LTLEAGQTGKGESFAPFAHDLAGCVEASGDEVIGEPFGRQENDSGADYVAIR
jgi:hypothetical protein